MAIVALAVVGALLVSVGFGLANFPAGVVTAGVECLAAAYVAAYVKARTT